MRCYKPDLQYTSHIFSLLNLSEHDREVLVHRGADAFRSKSHHLAPLIIDVCRSGDSHNTKRYSLRNFSCSSVLEVLESSSYDFSGQNLEGVIALTCVISSPILPKISRSICYPCLRTFCSRGRTSIQCLFQDSSLSLSHQSLCSSTVGPSAALSKLPDQEDFDDSWDLLDEVPIVPKTPRVSCTLVQEKDDGLAARITSPFLCEFVNVDFEKEIDSHSKTDKKAGEK